MKARGGAPERAPRLRLGRPPSLTARGMTWAAGGALLFVAGAVAGSWRVCGLGLLHLAALGAAYLAFYPASVVVWRRHLELQWGVERPPGDVGLLAGRPFRLVVTLRNLSPLALGRARLRVFSSSALEVRGAGGDGLAARLPARREVTIAGEVVPLKVGAWHLHGAAVELGDALGLCTIEAYFPSPLGVQIFPRPGVRIAPPEQAPVAGAPHERLGLHALRHRGLGGDLRELRDHAPGDSFKLIAWKATARTGKLMVRDLDRETMVTHFLLVDLGPTMREGATGATRLDVAVDLANAYARATLEAGDRVGLMTYDGRIVGEVRPNDGAAHRRRLVEPLMEAMNAVDEDLTEPGDSEVVEAVARYLRFQEGLDARIDRPPRIDDPRWAQLSSTPSGALYDLPALLRAVDATAAPAGGSVVLAATPEAARLRRYCRRRGIELPARRASEPGRRAAGLAAALERAAAGRGTQRIVVLSDLEGLESGLDGVARAVRLVRRRGHQLVCATPHGRTVADRDGDRAVIAEIIGWETDRRQRAARRRVAQLGVRVVPFGGAEASFLALDRR